MLGSIGGLFTAIFLFLSGYGLMYSFKNKQDYFHTYQKRLLRVLIPYWLIDILILIYFLISNQKVNMFNWVLSLFAIQISPPIATYWFVSAIIIMYISFYLSFVLYRKKESSFPFIIILLCILVYSFVCIIILNLHGVYTGTIFSFFFGILWYCKNKNITYLIKRNYAVSIIASFCTFFVFYASAKFIDNYSVPLKNILSFVFNNLAVISFIMCIMIVLQKIELKGNIPLFLGSISYEIYLVHITVIGVLKLENIMRNTNENIFVIFVVLFTIPITFLVHYVSNKISKHL